MEEDQYVGAVQLTPFRLLVAFVKIVGLSRVVNAHNRGSFSNGKWSIVSSSCFVNCK